MLQPIRFYHPAVTQILNLVEQLQHWQSASTSAISAAQQQQLMAVLVHAHRYSPAWRQRLEQAAFSPSGNAMDTLSRLPALSRDDLQADAAQFRAHWPDMPTRQIKIAQSSGSTGTPVRVEKDISRYQPLYSAISWLETQWHQRDPNRRFAVLGTGMKPARQKSWGNMHAALGYHGESEVRAAEQDSLDGHLDWLQTFQPDYLKCSPNLAGELAGRALQRGITLPLKQVLSHWERISPHDRALCQQAFAAPIIDRYSCEELGWLALECPTHGKLHAVSPTVLLEIVDDELNPCPPGAPGRVLATSLQNAVMPLIRYDLGDLAQWGEPCGCGLAWPVIDKLWGRERHMIELSNGTRIPMPFLGDEIGRIKAVRQFQIRQYQGLDLELLVSSDRSLTQEELHRLQQIFTRNGLADIPLHIRDQQQIDWGKGRKRQEFIRIDQSWQAG